jgi:hypothetical protein
LSNAYDAAIQLYVLTNSEQSPANYWTTARDDDWERLYALTTLERLDAMGVHVAVVAGY